MGKNDAQIKYRKKAIKTLYLDMNLKTDADILEWLSSAFDKKATVIKSACRKQRPRNMEKSDISERRYQCPNCKECYFPPSSGVLFSYCPSCGQAIRNQTEEEQKKSEAFFLEWDKMRDKQLFPPEACTLVEESPEACTLVEKSPEACTLVDRRSLHLYEVTYITKKGGETRRTTPEPIEATSTREAVKSFREWHKKHMELKEGHAFQVKATR